MRETAKLVAGPLEPTELLSLLLEVSERISSTLDLDELMVRVAEITRRAIDYEVFAILLLNEKTQELRIRFSIGHPEDVVRTLRFEVGEGIVGRAAQLGRSVLVNDVREDPSYIQSLPAVRSELAVPLIVKNRVIGVVDLESPQLGYFTDEHARIFSTLAPQIAIAIENAQLYERVARSEARLGRDLQRAQEIQTHMMPALCPTIPGLEVCARFQPARELGGDLYDFLTYDHGRYVLAIGDVSGKGAPAALYGAMASGILRSLAPQRPSAPEMLKKLNLMLLERKIEGHFITLTYAIWEPTTCVLRLSNAGMPLPILVRDGRSQPIRAEGVPLGLLEHAEYDETSVTLEAGDLLALFSDGLLEAASPSHEEFGMRRLENLLRQNAKRPLGEICASVAAEVEQFEEGFPRRDDQTLLLVRVQ